MPRGLRPVAPELMRASERIVLKRIVDHMESYGLNLKLEAANEERLLYSHKTTYSLAPEIDRFHQAYRRIGARSAATSDYKERKFGGGGGGGGGGGTGIYMSSAVKQIISHELETRKVRTMRGMDAEANRSLRDRMGYGTPSQASPNPNAHGKGGMRGKRGEGGEGGEEREGREGREGEGRKEGEGGACRSDHWLNRLKDRAEEGMKARHVRAGACGGGFIFPMLYTYHEGVTNAVKRRVQLKEIV